MTPTETTPVQQEVHNPEVAGVKAEVEQARIDAARQLGTGTVKLVEQPDGSLATSQELAHARANGQEASEVYKGGRR